MFHPFSAANACGAIIQESDNIIREAYNAKNKPKNTKKSAAAARVINCFLKDEFVLYCIHPIGYMRCCLYMCVCICWCWCFSVIVRTPILSCVKLYTHKISNYFIKTERTAVIMWARFVQTSIWCEIFSSHADCNGTKKLYN